MEDKRCHSDGSSVDGKLRQSYDDSDGKVRQTGVALHAFIFDSLSASCDSPLQESNQLVEVILRLASEIRRCGNFDCMDPTWLLEDTDDFDAKFQTMAQTALGDYDGSDLQRDDRTRMFRALVLFVYTTDMYNLTNDEELKKIIRTRTCEMAEIFQVNWNILLQVERYSPFYLAWGASFSLSLLLFAIYRLMLCNK